jgi:hypothetical protein
VPKREPQPPAAADPAQTIASIRAELDRLRSGLRRVEDSLETLELAGRQSPDPDRQRPERYLRVLVDVYEHGGQHGVDGDGLAAIGSAYGYDRRGLGGFFTGRRAPLRRAEDRVTLTPHGQHLVDVYLHRLDR